MARIKLIVTGDMEKLALHESLKRYFPSSRNGEEVVWDKPHCVSIGIYISLIILKTICYIGILADSG
jgi:hypothetical protein